jgi:hypothetical protein
MISERSKPRNKHELAVVIWKKLGCVSIGASELECIQRAVTRELGEGAVESPASLARTLADGGARLRHPEVIEADTQWRRARLFELFAPNELDFSTLPDAANSIRKLEELRQHFESEEDSVGLDRLRKLALGSKDQLLLLSKSAFSLERNQQMTKEMIEWLTIWLQSPALFEAWLSLRRDSPQFIEMFGR